MAESVPSWEYMTVYYAIRGTNLLIFNGSTTPTVYTGDRFTWLAEMGSVGWELVAVIYEPETPLIRAYFKRCTLNCK